MTLHLSMSDLAQLQKASRTLLSPLDYASVDGWRSAVNADLMSVVNGDSAMFTLLPAIDGQVIYSDQVSHSQLADYEGLTVQDEGADRAIALGLEVFNQTRVVAGDWRGYESDPVVEGFYKPNRLLDAIGFFLPNLTGGAVAALEIHKHKYGTDLFGDYGLERLQLLLPAFKAGVETLLRLYQYRGTLSQTLDQSLQPAAIVTSAGDVVHMTPRLTTVLGAYPEAAVLQHAIKVLARQVTSVAATRAAFDPSAACGSCTVKLRENKVQLRATLISAGLLSVDLAAVVCIDLKDTTAPDDAVLREQFGLTRRECEIARLLGRRISAAEIAMTLGISLSTARRHTESVFAKLGVHSRGEVAGALSTSGER